MSSSAPGSAGHVHRAYAQGPHGQVHFRRSGPVGARSPILLLHPFPGSSFLFEAFMAELGQDRSVIAPDMPGFGMSDTPAEHLDVAGYAAAMLELVAEMGLAMVDVMGYHAGGSIAIEMARQQPDVVRKVVMISALIFPAENVKAARERVTPDNPDDLAAGLAQGWQFFKTQFWRMGKDPRHIWKVYLDAIRDSRTVDAGRRAVLDYELAKALPDVNQPILLFNPSDDVSLYTSKAEPLMKNGTIFPLPEWTHGFLDSKPREVAGFVRAFLDK